MSVIEANDVELMSHMGNIIPHTYWAKRIMESILFKTFKDTDEVFYYYKGRYVPNGETIIKQQCEKIITNCDTGTCREVINTIRRRTYIDRSEFDAIRNLVNLKNGMYDIEKGILLRHSPKYLSRVQHPIEYKLGVRSKEFTEFLETCFHEEKDRISILEEIASIFLDGMKFEKAFLHEGIGSNGKSTCFHIIDSLAGEENVSHVSIHELTENRFAASRLDGKCLNTCAEISDDELKQIRKLKALISGDPIEVEKKGKDMFTMKNRARMFFGANKLPEINKFREAELRRFIVTHWNQKFKSKLTQEDLENGIKKADIELNEKLTTPENLSGIFNLVMIHARKLIQQKRFTYEQSVEQLEREWKNKEDVIETFVNLYLKVEEGSKVAKSTVFEKYEMWCSENKIIPKSFREFNSRLKELLELDDTRSKIEDKTTVVWSNLQIKVTELPKLPILLTGITEKEEGEECLVTR